MNAVEKPETKEAIMEVASELFSVYGYSGTSVREIAHKSKVNIAAINYHFGNKHNLYWATIDRKQKWLDEGVAKIAETCRDPAKMTVEAFRFLMTDQAAVRSTLKMMLTDGVPEPDGAFKDLVCSELGPPGAQSFMKVLREQTPSTVTDEELFWAVKCIFAGLIHFAMIASSCKFDIIKHTVPGLDPKGIEDTLYHHTKAILKYLDKK